VSGDNGFRLVPGVAYPVRLTVTPRRSVRGDPSEVWNTYTAEAVVPRMGEEIAPGRGLTVGVRVSSTDPVEALRRLNAAVLSRTGPEVPETVEAVPDAAGD
jgi:hypothetical protein